MQSNLGTIYLRIISFIITTTTMDNKKRVYTFGNGKAEGNAQMREVLGGKGANCAEMNLVGVPVPPGFTITTDTCNEYYQVGQEKIMELLNDEVLAAVKHVEDLMNCKFGDPANPLLVSVRSGARASMPGMMDTILNLGLNDTVAEGMTKKTNNPHFVYDSYRRFVQMYGDVVLGLKPVNKEDIDPFEEIIEKVKKEQANFIKDEKIKNPLENKSLDDMLKYEDTFDTNELFENTKIVPNKVNNDMESSLFKVASEAPMNEKEDKKEDTPIWEPIDIPTDNSKADDLFKDVNENVSLEVPAEKEEVKKEIPKEEIEKKDNSTSIFPESPMKDKTKDNSIYDILENNQNIIWKTTESKKSFNEIPVIENKNKNSSGFSELGSKEGEVLWKETL